MSIDSSQYSKASQSCSTFTPSSSPPSTTMTYQSSSDFLSPIDITTKTNINTHSKTDNKKDKLNIKFKYQRYDGYPKRPNGDIIYQKELKSGGVVYRAIDSVSNQYVMIRKVKIPQETFKQTRSRGNRRKPQETTEKEIKNILEWLNKIGMDGIPKFVDYYEVNDESYLVVDNETGWELSTFFVQYHTLYHKNKILLNELRLITRSICKQLVNILNNLYIHGQLIVTRLSYEDIKIRIDEFGEPKVIFDGFKNVQRADNTLVGKDLLLSLADVIYRLNTGIPLSKLKSAKQKMSLDKECHGLLSQILGSRQKTQEISIGQIRNHPYIANGKTLQDSQVYLEITKHNGLCVKHA